MIVGGYLIKDFRFIRKRLKSVSEAFGYIDHQTVAGSQFYSEPFSPSRRVRPQIDDYIVNRAASAANQLRFLVRGNLVMHSSQRAPLLIERGITLHHLRIQAASSKLFLAPGSREKATLVIKPFRLDNKRAFQLSFVEFDSHVFFVACRSPVLLVSEFDSSPCPERLVQSVK